jgi:hypothetical protein
LKYLNTMSSNLRLQMDIPEDILHEVLHHPFARLSKYQARFDSEPGQFVEVSVEPPQPLSEVSSSAYRGSQTSRGMGKRSSLTNSRTVLVAIWE